MNIFEMNDAAQVAFESCVLLLLVIYYNHAAILAAIFGFGSVNLLTG